MPKGKVRENLRDTVSAIDTLPASLAFQLHWRVVTSLRSHEAQLTHVSAHDVCGEIRCRCVANCGSVHRGGLEARSLNDRVRETSLVLRQQRRQNLCDRLRIRKGVRCGVISSPSHICEVRVDNKLWYLRSLHFMCADKVLNKRDQHSSNNLHERRVC